MLNPKQKAYLKSLAHPLKAVFQIGKDGINDNLLTDVRHYLEKHEIIKISVLQNSDVEEDEIVETFEDCGFEFVQHIGRVYVFYMHSDKVKCPIELPVKKNK